MKSLNHSLNDHLAVVNYMGSRNQLRTIEVDGEAVADYELDPLLFSQEFSVQVTVIGESMGLKSGKTFDPLTFISTQLRDNKS